MDVNEFKAGLLSLIEGEDIDKAGLVLQLSEAYEQISNDGINSKTELEEIRQSNELMKAQLGESESLRLAYFDTFGSLFKSDNAIENSDIADIGDDNSETNNLDGTESLSLEEDVGELEEYDNVGIDDEWNDLFGKDYMTNG